MRIQDNGLVGVGTIAPKSMLSVAGGVAIGATYAGTNAALTNGLLVEGTVLIGRTTVRQQWVDMVDVQGGPLVVTDGTADVLLSCAMGGTVGTRTNHPMGLATNNSCRVYITEGGNVGVGYTTTPQVTEKLCVNGNIKVQGKVMADSVVINGSWVIKAPDYVFGDNYRLRNLGQVEKYVKQNKHLPDVPSAQEMQKNGVNVGELNMVLLKKVEELTLYVVQQQKEIDALKASRNGR